MSHTNCTRCDAVYTPDRAMDCCLYCNSGLCPSCMTAGCCGQKPAESLNYELAGWHQGAEIQMEEAA